MRAFEGLPTALERLRRLRSLTQTRLGELAGVDAGNISRYESGEVVPSLVVLGRLLDGMGADVALLGMALAEAQGRAQMPPGDEDELDRRIRAVIRKMAGEEAEEKVKP